MTAEMLRRAATLMRERATDAFHDNSRDLWTDMATIDPENEGWIVCEQRQADVDWDTTVARLPYDYEGRVARHIASWHPAVALAVADWLDVTATKHECATSLGAVGLGSDHPALAVASAYLAPIRPESGGER